MFCASTLLSPETWAKMQGLTIPLVLSFLPTLEFLSAFVSCFVVRMRKRNLYFKQLRKEGWTFGSHLRMQPITMDKGEWWESEAACHITLAARKQGKVNACVQLTFFFSSVYALNPWNISSHILRIFPTQFTESRYSLKDIPRHFFPW